MFGEHLSVARGSRALCASVHSMPLSISRSLYKNVYESLDRSSGPFGRNLDESLYTRSS